MSCTNLSARVDAEDKKNFEIFCENTGLNVSVAVNLFIKAVLRESKILGGAYDSGSFIEKSIDATKKRVKRRSDEITF